MQKIVKEIIETLRNSLDYQSYFKYNELEKLEILLLIFADKIKEEILREIKNNP